MKIEELIVMQANLRYDVHERDMVEHVKSGKFWNLEQLKEYSEKTSLERVSPLIAINKFEDGQLYLHDGNHRTVSCWLGGRNYLREDEYFITNWTYKEYLEIAPENNWYTPFDPRIHVRTADFSAFKQKAKEMFQILSREEGIQWVLANCNLFRTNRTIKFLPELAAKIWPLAA